MSDVLICMVTRVNDNSTNANRKLGDKLFVRTGDKLAAGVIAPLISFLPGSLAPVTTKVRQGFFG
jgi:hypothetical protein